MTVTPVLVGSVIFLTCCKQGCKLQVGLYTLTRLTYSSVRLSLVFVLLKWLGVSVFKVTFVSVWQC